MKVRVILEGCHMIYHYNRNDICPSTLVWLIDDTVYFPPSDQFTSMEVNSLAGQEIVNAVYGSYIDTSYKNQWNVDGIVCIHNPHLLRAYG